MGDRFPDNLLTTERFINRVWCMPGQENVNIGFHHTLTEIRGLNELPDEPGERSES